MSLTEGHLLGGRVAYRQFAQGFRTGIEPALLAAAIPALPGERVIEAGTGAGAALLCLAARVAGVAALGVERDAGLAALARQNVAENFFSSNINVINEDIREFSAPGGFHHAAANPPWHDPASTPSPDASRDVAKRAAPALLGAWVATLARVLRPGGSLTLILPAAKLPAAVAAYQAEGCGGIAIFPLWPLADRPAKLVLLQGWKDRAGPSRLLPGLVLHEAAGGYTSSADSVLRDGAALDLGGSSRA